MSRANRQALAVLGAASIALQTIKNSFEIGPQYQTKINVAHLEILRVCAAWPGPLGNLDEGRWMSERLGKWAEQVKKDIRLGQWVMCTLAAVSVQAITDLYERPTSRVHRGLLLNSLIGPVTDVFYHVEGGWQASAESNELAEKMLGELYRLIGWEDVKTPWAWGRAA